MFSTFLFDAQLYLRLIKMQLRTQVQYKVDLFLDILTSFLLTILEYAALLLYFVSFPTMLGWQVGEVAMLSAVASVGFGLAELLGGGIDNFDTIIRLGDFDRLLLRPIAALLQVSTTQFRLRRVGRIAEGSVAFVVALFFLRNLHLTWNALKLLALVLGILSSSLIFLAILLLGAAVCFWTVEVTELTSSLTYGGYTMLSYPLSVYHQLLQRFFVFVLPLAFGSYIPVCYVLGRALPFGLPDWLTFVSPLAAFLCVLAALAFWRFGVRHYQGTGS